MKSESFHFENYTKSVSLVNNNALFLDYCILVWIDFRADAGAFGCSSELEGHVSLLLRRTHIDIDRGPLALACPYLAVGACSGSRGGFGVPCAKHEHLFLWRGENVPFSSLESRRHRGHRVGSFVCILVCLKIHRRVLWAVVQREGVCGSHGMLCFHLVDAA